MRNNIYIIEHLEPELWPWCIIEYENMAKLVGKKRMWFTNIQKKDVSKLEKFGKVFTESVKTMDLQDTCVLDPESKILLTPKDSQEFQYFIFGGILGDHPPKKRTELELTKFIKDTKTRNIGKEQFSTDSAVYVTDQILSGKNFSELKFQDVVDIKLNDVETVTLPFRYPLINGKPNITKKLIKYLKTAY